MPAARFVEIAESIDEALIAESARWGDFRDQLYTPHNQLLSLRNSLLSGWFPQRSRILLNQFRAQGLYPSLAAAEFNQHGGSITPGFGLTASAPQGVIYYTTDGSDPRTALTGVASPTAQVLDGPLTLNESTHVKTRVLSGGTWSALDEATFLVQPPALAISEIHFNPAAPSPASPLNNDDFEFIELFNYSSETIDLAGVRLIDGVQFDFTGSSVTSLDPGQYVVVVKDMAAFALRYDTAGINIAGPYWGTGDQLSNSGERITLVDRFDQTIADFKFKDGWHDLADGEGFSLTRTDPRDEGADLETRAAWRPSSDIGGSPGEADRRATPDFRAVLINELLTHTDEAPGDRIELYNTTDAAIDLAGWLLSDDPLQLDKYVIPSPAVIGPGGYLVFDQSQHFGNPDAAGVNEPFGFNELGGRAILSAADPSGLLGYRTSRQFGAAEREVSFGLHVKSSGGDDFVAVRSQTFGAANAKPLIGAVVINELRYRPGEDRLEFIELRNTSDAAVSLAGWLLDGVQFVFPPEAVIEAGGLLIVAPVNPQSFRAAESVAADVPILGPYLGALNNGGEDLRLFMPGPMQPDGTTPLIQVDRVKYDNKEPWPLAPAEDGASLQRVDPSAYGNDVANWIASLDGGTPGNTPPQVVGVSLLGSSWSDETALAIPSGEEQLTRIPRVGVDQIAIQFSEDVAVSRADLTVQGVNVAEYRFADFQYDAASFTAVWTLAQTSAADKLRLVLGGVSDAAGWRRLDGNWQDAASLFPSGNGLIEEDDVFRFRIDLLPGDVDGNGEVSRGDLLAVLGGLGSAIGESRFDARLDVDANGRVDVDDLRAMLRRIGTRRPAGEPGSGAAPPIIATDAVFSRLGDGDGGGGPGNNLIAADDVLMVEDDPSERAGPARIPRFRAFLRRCRR